MNNEYNHLLATYRLEMESPYNDGYSQLHYKEQYENLLKMGEVAFTRKMLNLKVKDLENKISSLTRELNKVKSRLLVIN